MPITVNVNGCPNACSRTQVADIGLKGQLVMHEGEQVSGFQVHLGGATGLQANFGRKLRAHKVTSEGLDDYVTVVVGKNRPTVSLHELPAGGLFDWGQDLTLTASASDPQDGTPACSAVVVRAALGHQEHAHEEGEGTGCGATFNTGPVHAGPDSVLFFVLRGSYTDSGATGSVPLTGEKEISLYPKPRSTSPFVSIF